MLIHAKELRSDYMLYKKSNILNSINHCLDIISESINQQILKSRYNVEINIFHILKNIRANKDFYLVIICQIKSKLESLGYEVILYCPNNESLYISWK